MRWNLKAGCCSLRVRLMGSKLKREKEKKKKNNKKKKKRFSADVLFLCEGPDPELGGCCYGKGPEDNRELGGGWYGRGRRGNAEKRGRW